MSRNLAKAPPPRRDTWLSGETVHRRKVLWHAKASVALHSSKASVPIRLRSSFPSMLGSSGGSSPSSSEQRPGCDEDTRSVLPCEVGESLSPMELPKSHRVAEGEMEGGRISPNSCWMLTNGSFFRSMKSTVEISPVQASPRRKASANSSAAPGRSSTLNRTGSDGDSQAVIPTSGVPLEIAS